MKLFEAYRKCIENYAVFSGRARRREYWYFTLCNFIVSALISVPSSLAARAGSQGAVMAIGGVSLLYSLFVLLPGISVTVRRLHDTDRGGGYYFLVLIPLAGPIILLVFLCTDGTPGVNRFGPDPKRESMAASPLCASGSGDGGALPVGMGEPDEFADREEKKTLAVSCMAGPNVGAGARGEVVYLGRDPELCQLTFPDAPGVSKVHCMLHTDGETIEIRDLNSSYGTFLADGTRLEPEQSVFVRDGCCLYLGSKNIAVSVRLQ